MADTAQQTAQQTPRKTPAKKTPKKASAVKKQAQQQAPDDVDDSQMTNGYDHDDNDEGQEQGDGGFGLNPEEQAEDAQEEGEQAAEGAGEEAQSTAEGAQEEAEDLGDQAQDQAEDAQQQGEEAADEGADQAQATADDAGDQAQDQADQAQGQTEGAADQAQDQAEGAADQAQDEGGDVVPIGKVDEDGKTIVSEDGTQVGNVSKGEPPAGSVVDQEGDVLDDEGNVIGAAEPNADNVAEPAEGAKDQAEGAADEAKDTAEGEAAQVKPKFEGLLKADKDGNVKDEAGNTIATLQPDELKKLGKQEIADIDAEGNLLDKDGNVLASSSVTDEAKQAAEDAKVKPEFQGLLKADKDGNIKDESGKIIATLQPDQLKKLGKQEISDIDADGNLLDKDGNVLAQSEISPPEELDYTILKGKKVNKAGNVVEEDGTIIGRLVEGDAAKLAGKACDEEGRIWNDSGKQIGQAEPLPESERQATETKPFEDFPGAVVEHSGDVSFEGRVIGKLVEGDKKQCEGKKVDADGDVSDKNGNTIGRAERLEDEPEEAPPEIDYSILIGHKVNKSGQIVDESNGRPLGKVVEGEVKNMIGRTVGKEGQVFNDSGDPIGKAEPLPENERIIPTESPFEDFPDAVVQKNGDVMYEGQKVGEVVEGDPKKLAGKHVDPEGDIVDKSGSVIGKAERWEEPEPEEEAPVDLSILNGKRVNKSGYVADPSSGILYGRVVEGDPKKLQGRMCGKDGNIYDEGGSVVGRAELIPESEREGSKTGPFSDFQPCTVNKEGHVVDGAQNIIGRLVDGDPKKLFGKQVDEDGDINDQNGNKIGSAERWEPEEKPQDQHPAAGLKVNKEGNVVDQNGDVIAKLTEGDIPQCRGKEVDNDGDVVDQKGKSVGHVTLLEDIKDEGPSEEELERIRQKEEEEKTQAEKQAEEEAAKKKDRDLAKRLGYEVDQTLERIKPVLDEMMEYIEDAEAKQNRKEEVDEDQLVNNVKPLIHKGSDILNECNSNIRNMDPDGRIQQQAKQKAGSEEASPEEQHLAEGLKELTGNVQDTIEKAKSKIRGMPKAEEGLNPLWGLLSEPLFQILAAVGLLLSGVLGLVGKLLGGLGLGGLVDGILGGLGVNQLLEGVTGMFKK